MIFEVHQVKLADEHPLWPGQSLFKIWDADRKEYGFSGYTTLKVANEALETKLSRLRDRL